MCRMAAEGGGERLVDVVVTMRSDITSLGLDAAQAAALQEGVYVVGTGSTGAAATFAILGTSFSLAMLCGAFSFRVPAKGWQPDINLAQTAEGTRLSFAYAGGSNPGSHRTVEFLDLNEMKDGSCGFRAYHDAKPKKYELALCSEMRVVESIEPEPEQEQEQEQEQVCLPSFFSTLSLKLSFFSCPPRCFPH